MKFRIITIFAISLVVAAAFSGCSNASEENVQETVKTSVADTAAVTDSVLLTQADTIPDATAKAEKESSACISTEDNLHTEATSLFVEDITTEATESVAETKYVNNEPQINFSDLE